MTEDEELYSLAKGYVKKSISGDYNQPGNTLILSISRKGPKFLEYLFGRNQTLYHNVITEVALPFCMRRLSVEGSHINVKVFDDAIYFGTTAEGIVTELKAFEEMYNINASNSLYTAIRAQESRANFGKSLEGVAIHSYTDESTTSLRKGYGHYFIRRLEKDFSEMGNTMEVEFPIIEYRCDNLNQDLLLRAFQDVYGDDSYIVKRYNQKSLSVVFQEIKGQAFRKIRVYTCDKVVRIVGMAPWHLPNDMSVIFGLFSQSPFNSVWEKLQEAYSVPMAEKGKYKAYLFVQVERCIRKSLIIMANYILSYQLLLVEKVNIEKALSSATDEFTFDGVQMSDLFYLIGVESLCHKIKSTFDYLWQISISGVIPLIGPNLKALEKKVDYQVFENSDFPDYGEMNIFEQRNSEMLRKCKDVKEALSVIFFNQTSLIEKRSRVNDKYDFSRLRFGYTYDSIQSAFCQIFGEEKKIAMKRDIHQWMDSRIDQACVVPQYIVDGKTNMWVRAFRPGENEEALISHLARYVIAIFRCVDDVQGLGWVYEKLFRELLCLSVVGDFTSILRETFEFILIPDFTKRTLCYQYELQPYQRDVLDFMLDMKILECNKGILTISRELYDDEMMEATTLDVDIQNIILANVDRIMRQIIDGKYEKYPFFITNFYFFQDSDLEALCESNRTSFTTIQKVVSYIKKGEGQDSYAKLVAQDYYSSQRFVVSVSLLEKNNLLSHFPLNDSTRAQYMREMIVLWMIKFTYELIIVSFLHTDTSFLAKEVAENVKDVILYGYRLELDSSTRDFIRGMINSGTDRVDIQKIILGIINNRLEQIPKVKI